eukprot:TRINITY_DN26992_c0_g1_i1.p1 TRINITY_DN26992_c0_g1~~TRINITY_DN26992_c0_g1_i1.p1  ORF type:complete len:518 (-),score=95.10 TRINITY_DN26992_c0_g1_i1:63-1424(-)
MDEQNIWLANQRKTSLEPIYGPEYKDLVIPAIPASDYKPTKDAKPDALPLLVSRPLVKCADGPVKGIQSGIRSALIKDTQGGTPRWYRLKGCGNIYDGFPLAPVENDKFPSAKQIRGCAFLHTTTRELFITDAVEKLLLETPYKAANKPLGWWEYSFKEQVTFPKIERCCIVMETYGNRRLGDNLLLGLERLIPALLDGRFCEGLRARFPAERLIEEEEEDSPVHTTAMVSLTGGFGGEQDFHDFEMWERVPEGDAGLPMDPKWEPLWRGALETLSKYVQAEGKKRCLLSHLYWRLGRECGAICRTLWKNDLSWGTYEDILGFHCNAHVNNLVVLPKGPPGSALLSPLDFDMAFFKSTFSLPGSLWEDWKILELNGMKMVLAGDPETSTGVLNAAVLDRQGNLFRYALRDTMMVAFNEAVEEKPDRHPPILEIEDYLRALIDLALIVTEKETA